MKEKNGDKPKPWEELTLDEKLTELGFEKDFVYTPRPDLAPADARMHGALDQLVDAGGMLVEIEAMVEPTARGNPTGDEVNTCVAIHELITEEDDDDGEDEDEPS